MSDELVPFRFDGDSGMIFWGAWHKHRAHGIVGKTDFSEASCRIFPTGYMQQRYYDPMAGRFLSTDPVAANAGSFNRYWYASNNPYKYIDPDGRFESPAYLLSTVPGQGSFDAGMTSLEGGQYGMAAAHFGAMLGEQALTVATLGYGKAATAPASVVANAVNKPASFSARALIDELVSASPKVKPNSIGNYNYSVGGGRAAWDAARNKLTNNMTIDTVTNTSKGEYCHWSYKRRRFSGDSKLQLGERYGYIDDKDD